LHELKKSKIFVSGSFAKLLKEEISTLLTDSIDTGLSNVVGFRLFETKGKLIENLVAIELKMREKNFIIGKNMENRKNRK